VANGFGAGEPCFDLGEASSLEGPTLLARLLSPSSPTAAEGDVKLQRKAAFLLHALCSSDDLNEEWAAAYAEACAAPLVAILASPPAAASAGAEADAASAGVETAGCVFDVDLRESSLRALATLAGKSARCSASVFAAPLKGALALAQGEATARAVALGRSGKDADAFANAKVEVGMWKALFSSVVS